MSEISLLNEKFEVAGKISSSVDLNPENIHTASVHQVVKALLAAKRQGTASTKTRGEVRGGGAKPFRQKGTGRARQGSTRSPILVGGGTIFGPRPRSYEQKVNKKVMLKALWSVIADKHQANKLFVLDKIESSGKTKEMNKELEGRGLQSSLIVTSDRNHLALRACRNLAKASGVSIDKFNVYDALKYENLIIEKDALNSLLERCSKIKKS